MAAADATVNERLLNDRPPAGLWYPLVMREGVPTLAEVRFDRLPAVVRRSHPREVPKLMVGFGVVFVIGILVLFLAIQMEVHGGLMPAKLVDRYVLVPMALAEIGPLALLMAGLWRLLRREQIVVDLHEIAVRRRWLFWQRVWREPINGYDGLVRVRVRRWLGWAQTDPEAPWSRQVDIIVLRHRTRGRSIVLAASAPGALSDELWRYYRQFLPAAGERDPLGTFDTIWLRTPRREDVSPAPTIADPDLPGDPVRGRWDRTGVIWSVLCTIAAGPVLMAWGPAAVGLLIAGSAIPPLIRGKAFLFWHWETSSYTVARFLEGLQARALAILVLALGLGWYAWFQRDFPIAEWHGPWQSMQQFRAMDEMLKSSVQR